MLLYSYSLFCYLDCNMYTANPSTASKRTILRKTIGTKRRKHTNKLTKNAHKKLIKKAILATKPINNIVNLSSAHISTSEISLLNRGLSFGNDTSLTRKMIHLCFGIVLVHVLPSNVSFPRK